MLGDGIAADGGALHSELHTKATMRKKGGDNGLQNKENVKSGTQLAVFFGNINKNGYLCIS